MSSFADEKARYDPFNRAQSFNVYRGSVDSALRALGKPSQTEGGSHGDRTRPTDD